NELYVFYTAPGVKVTANGQNSIRNFAGYHDVFTDAAGAAVYYAVVPYPTGSLAAVSLTDFQQTTVVLSHEISEAVTDPDTQAGFDVTGTNPYGTAGSFAVAVTVDDANGNVAGTADTTATVAASASTVTAAGTVLSATAGQSFSGPVGTFTDSTPNPSAANYT